MGERKNIRGFILFYAIISYYWISNYINDSPLLWFYQSLIEIGLSRVGGNTNKGRNANLGNGHSLMKHLFRFSLSQIFLLKRPTSLFSFRPAGALQALVLLIVGACVPLDQQGTSSVSAGAQAEYFTDRTLRFEDHVYDPSIRTVQCYVRTGTPEEVLVPPVIPIDQNQRIMLEFDQVNHPQQRFVVKLLHCNADWSPSNLADIQFLEDYNEFFITDVLNSVNTQVPFLHYRFLVPRVKISGNYLLVVSLERGAPKLTHRLMVYENLVNLVPRPMAGVSPDGRRTHQQIDFDVFYPKYDLVNPAQEVKVVMRQNHRWDNVRTYLRPTFTREVQRKLEYTFFEHESSFPGLNQFRFFDFRSLRTIGMGVARLDRESIPREVVLQPERSRAGLPFSDYQDANGKFVIGNREFGNPETDADYAWVNFQLHAPEEAPAPVYVFGAFSNWKALPEYQLRYEADKAMYTGRAFLKQGYYNYFYVVKPPAPNLPVNEVYFEGSHFATENQYDIIVYYRPPGARADMLIAYNTVEFNARR
jgi:hypothetical protein